MKPGDFMNYTQRDHRRKGTVLRTSEGRFLRFVGEKSAELEFTRKDGSKLIAVVLVEKLKPSKESA